MAYLVANIPNIKVFVRQQYLTDLESDFDKLVEGYWVSVKSIKSRALYFETYLPEYGALFDKLPLSAFCWKQIVGEELSLSEIELWDCFSYNITVIEKSFLSGMNCSVYLKNKQTISGEYMFTIDSCHSEPNELNTTLSETSEEHKSFNIIKLNNGQFSAQPNNRIKFYDQSLTPSELLTPKFKTPTRIYTCEDGEKWYTKDDGQYFYEIDKK